MVKVGETELVAHLARTRGQARQRGAGFRTSRSRPGEVLECHRAGEGALLGKRDAFPVSPAHVSSAEQARAACLELRSAGDSG